MQRKNTVESIFILKPIILQSLFYSGIKNRQQGFLAWVAFNYDIHYYYYYTIKDIQYKYNKMGAVEAFNSNFN